jgi:hypothetical protein
MTSDMAVVTPLNNPGGPEGDTVTVDEQLLNTEYCVYWPETSGSSACPPMRARIRVCKTVSSVAAIT